MPDDLTHLLMAYGISVGLLSLSARQKKMTFDMWVCYWCSMALWIMYLYSIKQETGFSAYLLAIFFLGIAKSIWLFMKKP